MNELWSFDSTTYTWTNINFSPSSPQPPPREQHSAAAVNGDIYIFGGKSRIFPINPSDGTPLLTHPYQDTVFSDLWKLQLQKELIFNLTYPELGEGKLPSGNISQISTVFLPLNGSADASVRAVGDGVSPRAGYCVAHMSVTV